MILKNTSLAFLLIFVATCCTSKSDGNPETQKLVDEFFKSYKSNGHKEAITTFLAKNKWVTSTDANDVATQINDMVAQVGAYYGEEQISVTTYGTRIIQYIYIARYERQPLKYTFRFYKPEKNWQVQSFNYEVDFTPELNEAGKAYRLEENDDN